MENLLNEFNLDNVKFKNYKIKNTDAKILKSLSKINVFVGQNNSGKSRFVRNLLSFDVSNNFKTSIINELNKLLTEYTDKMLNKLNLSNKYEYDFSQKIKNNFKEIENISINQKFLDPINNYILNIRNMAIEKKIKDNDYNISKKILTDINELESKIKSLIESEVDITRFKRIYIPTLRGLRNIDSEKKSNLYELRTKKDYWEKFDNKAFDLTIFTGLEMYDLVKEHLLGDLVQRKTIENYQKFLSTNFFNNQEIALIPKINHDVLNIKIGNEYEQPIYNIGDGIQTVIIITFPLFLYQKLNMLVVIEEPEIYLHPGMQRRLIETLVDKSFINHQFFITTHSNHLLDLTLDTQSVSLYKFTKNHPNEIFAEEDPTFLIDIINDKTRDVLNLLGVRNSSVYLANCTIWVEGITDRLYIKKFIEIYQNNLQKSERNKTIFKEDTHYSFIEYGGNNITHWSFLDEDADKINFNLISNNIFLISDRDKKKDDRHQKLSENLKENYYCLECLEIENLLTPKVILSVIEQYEKDNFKSLDLNSTIRQKDYINEPLGKFIEEKIFKDVTKSKRFRNKDNKPNNPYKDSSGTIKDKIEFMYKALDKINYEEISEEALKICEKLYEFIEKCNMIPSK